MNQLSLAKPAPSTGSELTHLTDFNGDSDGAPALVHARFEAQATATPDAVALELAGHEMTYGELNAQANRLAHHLRRIGVSTGDLIGVSMERSFDLLVSIYAILKAGGAYVPLDPSYPRERLRYMADAAKLKLLITAADCRHLFDDSLGVDVLVLDDTTRTSIAEQPSTNPEPTATGDDLVYVIFTSGSTGQPKAAAVYHRGFANLVDWFVDEFAITSDDHALLVSSLSFDLTQKNLYATLVTGGTLHLYPPGAYDVSHLTRLIRDHGITLVNCTPSAFYPLVEPAHEAASSALASLRVVFLGGEPISIPRLRPWLTHPATRAEIANTYGPTECTDICGFYRLTRDNLDRYDFVPLGRAIHNVQMVIVDDQMQPCGVDVAGELCVGGAGVGAGYINDAEMTQAKFVAHELDGVTSSLIYKTGDQARWHRDGVIEFLGRLDHQVKIRGFRIELPEIERAAESHPGINAAIVIVRSDNNTISSGDAQLVCCYTLHPELATTVADLKNHLAAKLPSHMLPVAFEVFETFPLSPNGKVDRKALAECVDARRAGSATSTPATAAPRLTPGLSTHGSSFVDQVRAAWCDVLGRDHVELDDNFFDLGGESLRLARLHQHLESLVQREFPITDLFANPTVRGMSGLLASGEEAGGEAAGGDRQQQVLQRAQMQRAGQSQRAAQMQRAAQAARRRSRG